MPRNSFEAVFDEGNRAYDELYYWIYLVCESPTGNGLPAGAKRLRMKQWPKVPQIVRNSVRDPDVQQRILDALNRGTCWYFSLENRGWNAGFPKGSKDVPLVQDTLLWIERFRNQSTVGGNRLFWCQVESRAY